MHWFLCLSGSASGNEPLGPWLSTICSYLSMNSNMDFDSYYHAISKLSANYSAQTPSSKGGGGGLGGGELVNYGICVNLVCLFLWVPFIELGDGFKLETKGTPTSLILLGVLSSPKAYQHQGVLLHPGLPYGDTLFGVGLRLEAKWTRNPV